MNISVCVCVVRERGPVHLLANMLPVWRTHQRCSLQIRNLLLNSAPSQKQKGPKSSQMDLSAQKDTETILPPIRFLSPSAPSFQVAPLVGVLEPEPKNKHLAEGFYMQIL